MAKRYRFYEINWSNGPAGSGIEDAVRLTISITDEFYKDSIQDKEGGIVPGATDREMVEWIKRIVIKDLLPFFVNQAEALFLPLCAALRRDDDSILATELLRSSAWWPPDCGCRDWCIRNAAGEPPQESPLPPEP